MSETVMVQAQPQRRQGIRALSAYKSYLLLMIAKMVSHFGDSIDSIAYSWMVYMITGSEILMGTLFAFNFIPGIAFSLFTGVLVDRWPKKKILIIAASGRGVIVTLTALLYLTNHLQPWHLFIFTFINSTFQCFSNPAEMSIVPRLLPKELLLTGNSITASATRTAELGGLAVAGGLIALVGISGSMLINAATFFIAAILFLGIRFNQAVKSAVSPNGESPPKAAASYWKEFLSGFHYVRKQSMLVVTISAGAFVNLCLTPWNVLQPVYVKEILHSGPFGLSLLGISLVTGMVLSGIYISQKGSAFKKSTLIVFGYLLLGVTYSLLYMPAFIGFYPLYAAAICCFGMGFAISFINTPVSTFMMETTPHDMLGRIGALSSMIGTCTIPLGGLIAGYAGSVLDANHVFLIFGILMMIPGLLLLTQKKFMSV
ncbi:MFS transporter [Paenibacillus azoreducens]|uniref:MFS transporter n=1 Tax=Paenibacillus azoreducens TaxID=116718 RepID=A0A919YF06_9BACL|nr:MFS transporter [Paenibacillus azoreducens]GIO48063.1 MFS transporter [Paenibacillus azoreducens]